MSSKFVRVVAAALVILVALLVGFFAPLGTVDRDVVLLKWATDSFPLRVGQTLRQTVQLQPGLYSAIVFFSDYGWLRGQPVRVRLLDEHGDVVRSGGRVRVRSLSDPVAQIVVPISWLRIQEPQLVTVEVTTVAGRTFPVRVSPYGRDIYRPGGLEVAGQDVSRDMAVTFLERTRLNSGVRAGLFSGVIAALGVGLISLLPHSRWRWVGVGVLVAVVTPLALGGYWWSLDRLGIADWDYYFSLHHSYREILVRDGVFPFWNPYTCGGTAGLGDPEFPVFSLTFLLELLLGIPRGMRLAIWLSVAVTGVGMVALAHRLRLSWLAGVVAAFGGAFCSVSLLEITEGHVNVFAAMWIPWIFWSWYSAYRAHPASRELWTLLCGVFLALTFLAGGIYLLMYTGLTFLLLFLVLPSFSRSVGITVVSGVWALGLTAFKLVPVLSWLRQFPDDAYAGSAYTLPWLVDILFGRHLHGSEVVFSQTSGWHEYGAYVGYVLFGLALVGLSWYRRRGAVRVLLLIAVLAVFLSAVGPALTSLFDRLWWFPRSNISRLILFGTLPLSLLAGFGVDRLWWFGSWFRTLALVAVGFVVIDLLSLAYPLSLQAFVLPEVYPFVAPAASPLAFTPQRFDPAGSGSRTTRSYAAARAGYGTFSYCSVLGPGQASHVRTIYDEDNEIISIGNKGRYALLSWSANRVHVHVDLVQPASVVLNTNYVEGWTVNGFRAFNENGRVAYFFGRGVHDVVYQYTAPGFAVGWPLSVATVVGAVTVGGWSLWSRRRR